MFGFQLTMITSSEVEYNYAKALHGDDMIPKVTICDGCCCGRVEKGNKPVPLDELKKIWEERNLGKEVKLSSIHCLGPCSMNNVALLTFEKNRIWVGKLDDEIHYDAIVEWGIKISQNPNDFDLPEILKPLRFVPD